MDFTLRRDKSYSSYLHALKSTAKRSGRRPPSFPPPPHLSYLNSLPEYRLPNIPPDLVSEILSRLPIQSLLRFQCVCKPWRDSISDPRFALSFQNQKIAIRYGDLCDLNLHLESAKVSLVRLDQYPPRRKKEIGGTEEVKMTQFEIIGSCRGLLLIRRDTDLYLWNPSIRQCTKVLSLPVRENNLWFESFLTDCGLCYDSSTDEYKAVVAYEGCYDSGDGYKRVAIVASLKSKRWTGYRFPYKLKSGPVVNDRLHWVVKRDEDGTRFPVQQIVCFDPLVDKFVEFSTPPSYDGDRNVILGLGVLDGCLCVARYRHNESDYESDHEFGYWIDREAYDYKPDIEVLIMKEYDVEESWTSLFVMSHFEGLSNPYGHRPYRYGCFVPLCLTKNGKVLIAVNGKQILVYNPSEDSRKHITSATNIFACEESLVSPDSCGATNIFACEESLVSPDSCGGGNDWRIEQTDLWNLVYDQSNRVRQNYDQRQFRAYDPFEWDDMYDWEEDDDYDWEEEDFLKKEKQRHKMRIRTKNL